MDGDQSSHLEVLLDRMRTGDDSARNELIGCAYERLRLLARKMFHEDFPRLEQVHATGSVLHDAAIKLLEALRQVHPPTVRDFFTFAAVQIRRVLLDMARRRRPKPGNANPADQSTGGSQRTPPHEPGEGGEDPADLAAWADFHRKVEELSPEEREIVDLHWYQGLPQSEVARLLGIHPRKVSHRWLRVRLKLADWMPGCEPPPGEG